MKKIISFLLILCIIFPLHISAEEVKLPSVYIFGDDWAYFWGQELDGFTNENVKVVNCAYEGALLSQIGKREEYNMAGANDVVILSYGILEMDRPGDKNAEFKKNLDNVVKHFTKKGAEVVFASVCSTMRYNNLTGQMVETKNFYTETTRSYAKEKGIGYIDLSLLTAKTANKLGSGRVGALYTNLSKLTERGNKMCAFEVFKYLAKTEKLTGGLRMSLGWVKEILPGERSVVFDVIFEDEVSEYFTIYLKGGNGVSINGVYVEKPDEPFVCQSVGGKININFNYCEKVQITPCLRFDAQGFATTEAPFTGQIYPGIYDVTVRKTEPLKASVFLNDYLIAASLDMPGTQKVEEAAVHTFRDFYLEDGKISVTVKGLTDKLDYISFSESPVIYEKKPRIFVAGDSTVCNYYPLERTGEEIDGTVMTGWAMLLDRYVDAEVINFAVSGDWAKKWMDYAFSVIEKEGEKGDIFIIQFGINDRGHSTLEEMTSALTHMVDTAAGKGMIPILVSPQISAGYGWGDESDIGKSDGGRYQQFFDAVRELSKEKGCFYVDLTDLSSGWFSEIGRENVYKKYHLWNYEKNEPGDMMHLSYKGADAMCRFFVLGLEKISDAKETDYWGNSLEFLKIW